jgi:hypothetical protein
MRRRGINHLRLFSRELLIPAVVSWQHNCTTNVELVPPLPVSSPKKTPEESGSCHKLNLKDGCPAGLYGSKKNDFGVLVAPNAPGCSMLPARPLAIPLMK